MLTSFHPLPKALMPLLFVLLWSTGFIGAKFGLPYVEPLTFLCTRYLLVIVLMAALAFISRAPWPRSAAQYVHIGITGVLVHGIYLGGVFIAISHGLPAGVTSLVVGLQPLLTALGAGDLSQHFLAEALERHARPTSGRSRQAFEQLVALALRDGASTDGLPPR